MKVKCIEDFGEIGEFTFGKTYEVIREDDWMDYIVYNDYGKESFLEEHECEVIDEHQPQEWSGEGLPPVGGIVCHIETGNSVEIACYFHGSIVYWDFKIGGFHSGTVEDFKPIKSEKDKEIEEIVNLYEDAMPVEAFAEKLYELGYRKTK